MTEKVYLNEVDEILLQNKGSQLTKKELEEIGYQITEDFITKDKLDTLQKTFPEISLDDLDDVLSLTIKKDRTAKLITFLSMLTTYTEDSQVNISYNAPASTGKSYIPIEISKLFLEKDVIKVGYSSPTAFFHSTGELDPETHLIKINLSRKILIFLDQPHTELLQRLRPLLSHDQKELLIKITDKNKKGQNRTKNVLLIGFPVVIFCTASLKMDEQETSRVILLSPEISEEKFTESINQIIEQQGEKDYEIEIENNPQRQLLKERVKVIRQYNFYDVLVEDPTLILKYYSEKRNTSGLIPADQRNVKKLLSLIKGLTLLNFPHREIKGKYIIASQKDVEIGISLWREIEKYQELGIAPFIHWFYEQVFIPTYKEKNKHNSEPEGIKKKDLLNYQSKVFRKTITEYRLRTEILPTLINAGLIREEKDLDDKREKVYFPIEEGVKNV